MRERSHGDEVDPGAATVAHVVEGDPAGGLERRDGPVGPSGGVARRDRGAQLLEAHVVEQQAVGAGVERLGDLGGVAALDLDLALGIGLTGAPDRSGQAARERDVVLLDQDRVVQAHAVVRPPPAATAAFSSARRPGVVLRVSSSSAPVPSSAPRRSARSASRSPTGGRAG